MYTVRQPFFDAEGQEQSYVTDDWGTSLREVAVSDDEQPEQDSEEEVLESEETKQEETETESEGDGQEEEEEVESVDEDPDVDLGEGRQPVKMSELKQGYMRQSDYTKKTQELSTQRKEIETLQETLKPVQEWQKHMEANPWLWQQINTALQEFHSTGDLPLEEVMRDAQYGKYVNHLMAENNTLKKENESLRGEYEGVKLTSEMTRIQTELKADYGDLVTDEYMQQLQERAKAEKLSATTLKEIADGYLAKEKLKSNQTDVKKASKKAEAQAMQRLAETKKTAPTTPKVAAAAPSTDKDISSMSWLDALKTATEG